LPSLVSIVIPSYNKQKYIGETITSVVNQTYIHWELLIIDDASSDESISIINQFENDKRIQLFQNTNNKGANFCRNFGLQKAKGNYIIFLDADDLISSTCLENRLKFIAQNNVVNFAVFPMQSFKKNIGDDNVIWKPIKEKALEKFLSHKLPWQTMQPIWKRDFLLKLNGFDETFQRMQDVEMHTRALFNTNNFAVFNNVSPDCFYRVDDNRIQNPNKLILKFTESVLKYYDKFFEECKKQKLLPALNETIIETYIYCNVVFLKYAVDKATINAVRLSYYSKTKNRLLKIFIKTANFFFNKNIYPKGLKQAFKLLNSIPSL